MRDGATVKTSQFRPSNNCQDDVSLRERSKPENTQYKDRGLLMFSETGKLRARKKNPLLELGCVQRCSPYATP